MLRIWVDQNHHAPTEEWEWVKTVDGARELIESYWQDQWEMWYIDGIPQEQIENKCIISLPYFNMSFAEWLQSHKASANYKIHIHKEGENIDKTLS